MPDPADQTVPLGVEAAAAAKAGAAPDAGAPAPAVGAAQGVTRAMLAGVAVLALVAAGAAWQDGRRTQQAFRAEVAQKLSEIDAMTHAAAKAQTQIAADLRDTQAKITLLEARIAESQAQQASLEALYRDLSPSRDEIALTEIEQVLLVASQQLMLAGNVQSALAALQLADTRLQRLERPQFLPLRRALPRDMDRLKAMPFVDVAGMSVKLDQLLAGIDALPLAMDERLPAAAPVQAPPPASEPWWRATWRGVWAELRQLVRVEVADRPAAPLLVPSQQYFLRENLKLRLLSARIALLNHDDRSFKADVAAAGAWLRTYFDLRAKPVQAMDATLKQLAATPTAGDMPDLAGSLEALRVLRMAQDRTPARAPERAAGGAPRPPR